jgi:hypothetical protein
MLSTSVDKDVEKNKLLVGTQIITAFMKNNMEVPKKIKSKITICFSHLISVCI